ncbi:MAG: CocE/NonD family hydrolase C-terminal non-catalytic domain-containing protein [Steroidobacteraceae bacterium]
MPKGALDPRIPAALTYETGRNRWNASPRWPAGKPTPLFLAANDSLSFAMPPAGGHDDYVSDPARPVHIMGAPQVDLYAATSSSDSDWVVKLIDLYPDDNGYAPQMSGYELAVGIDIFRGRYVDGFDKPRALRPGKVERYRFGLPNVDHTFLPGHRIKVMVQSSLFPLYDRNPQTFVPGLVIMAVMVGGGYATGRELVEFFVSKGPATGLVGMALTAVLIGAVAMISFELARQFRTFDYRSFCKVLLGRFWWLFELAYLATLLIVLSVVSSAVGKMLLDMAGIPEALGSVAFMALGRFGNELGTALASTPVQVGEAAWSAASYAGYNVAAVPTLIFVARHFRTRSEALIAGAIAGPLILQRLDVQWLATLVKVVILGALIKTGAGMLHGLNERIEGALHDRGSSMPSWVRPAVALGCMVFAVYAASAVGIIGLIANGYRYASYVFWLVFLIPIFTYGLYLISRGRA